MRAYIYEIYEMKEIGKDNTSYLIGHIILSSFHLHFLKAGSNSIYVTEVVFDN